MKPLLMLMLATSLAVAAGCASSGRENRSELQARQSGDTYVQVSNNNWLDVNVFAVGGEHRVRLGMVTSMTTKMLRVPRTFMNTTTSLQLRADPIGSATPYSTEFISVWPGQTMSFAVENQLSLSRLILTSN